MSPTATRLLSLLSLLQVQRTWSGTELARRLQVSTRTVRYDIERLRELGYAVETTRGGIGGYRLGAGGACLPPLLLDPEEAVAVAVGLRSGVNCIIGGMEETALRALAKLEQVLPSAMRHRVRNLSHYTVPLPSTRPVPAVEPDLLTWLVGLCDGRERVRFWYANGDHPDDGHDVEPYRLVNRAHRWYLLGFDVQHGTWDVFDIDRLRPRVPTGPRFAPRELPSADLASYVADLVPESTRRHRAVVKVYAPAAEVEAHVLPSEGTVEPVDEESSTLYAGAESLRALALLLGRLDADFAVAEPPQLVEELACLAQRYTRAGPRAAPAA